MLDILLDDTNDIQIINGDIVTGVSDLQNQNLLLLCDKGDWKENPTVCVGVGRYLKDDDPGTLLAEIKKEFQRDGMTIKNIELSTDGILNIDANY